MLSSDCPILPLIVAAVCGGGMAACRVGAMTHGAIASDAATCGVRCFAGWHTMFLVVGYNAMAVASDVTGVCV